MLPNSLSEGKIQEDGEDGASVINGTTDIPLSPQKHLSYTIVIPDTDLAIRPWSAGRLYEKGDRVFYQDKVYEAEHPPPGQPPSSEGGAKKRKDWNRIYPSQGLPFNAATPAVLKTPFGQYLLRQIISHGLAVLAKSSRSFIVRICLPFSFGMDLSTFHTIDVTDPRLPRGHIRGKIVHYKLWAQGMEQGCLVTVACCFGDKDVPDNAASYEQWLFDQELKTLLNQVTIVSESEAFDKSPQGTDAVLKDISLKNDFPKQAQELAEQIQDIKGMKELWLSTTHLHLSLDKDAFPHKHVSHFILQCPRGAKWPH